MDCSLRGWAIVAFGLGMLASAHAQQRPQGTLGLALQHLPAPRFEPGDLPRPCRRILDRSTPRIPMAYASPEVEGLMNSDPLLFAVLNTWTGVHISKEDRCWDDMDFAVRKLQSALGHPVTGALSAAEVESMLAALAAARRSGTSRAPAQQAVLPQGQPATAGPVLELTALSHTTTLAEFKALAVPAACKWGQPDVHFYCLAQVSYGGYLLKDGAAVYFREGKIQRVSINAGPQAIVRVREELDRRFGAHEAVVETIASAPATTYSYRPSTALVPGPNGTVREVLAPAVAVPQTNHPTFYNRTTYRWKAACATATSLHDAAQLEFQACN